MTWRRGRADCDCFAEFYAQSALEGVLELKEFYQVRPAEIERIEVDVLHLEK
ncbi:MAG TPA: hypothetical protein VFQ30_21240 [Ktedonobacteraceae bacterium]|nr:hypothetical protein [Ktedonobacteraceae bacterium]